MAVFMVNICKFNGCGLTFPNLADLIQHIEDIHIDYDPRVVEQKELQQPPCLPLSYVLRFFTDAARKEGHEYKRKFSQNHGPKVQLVPHRSSTPTGSEADEDDLSESEDSNDSWASEEINTEFILKYGHRALNPTSNNAADKPFACPVPGCKKRYKNVNGIKYHSKNGHKQDGKIRKGFNCHCGKSYKTCQGLRNHTTTHHNGVGLTTFTTQNGEVLHVPANHVAALQPFHAVAVKHIAPATIGLPVKAIQGLVVATKVAESGNKGRMAIDSNFDTITFAKGSALQMTMPTLISQPKLIVNSNSAEHQTFTTALGVLTPATSPNTPPPDPATSVTSSSSTTSIQIGISADASPASILQTTCQSSEILVPSTISPQAVLN